MKLFCLLWDGYLLRVGRHGSPNLEEECHDDYSQYYRGYTVSSSLAK